MTKNTLIKAFFLSLIGTFLAACVATAPQFGQGFGNPNNPLDGGLNDTGLPPANGRILGTGPVRVAMLVPQSAQGFGALAAQNFTNAADLALREFSQNTVNIVVKDTQGTQEGSVRAAQEALAEGAEIILGPVFSNNVAAVASIARPAGIPVISFSNASRVAGRGVNVFGFTPEPGIERVIGYAGDQGSRAFAALLPNNALGTLAEAAFRQSVASTRGRIVSITRYNYENNEPVTRAQEVAQLAASGQIDTVFVPDAGDIAPQLVATIRQSAPQRTIRFIGSGQWDDPRIFRDQNLVGAIYPAPDRSGFTSFAARYNSAYGEAPIRLASLAYDATSLVIKLTQDFGDQRFSNTRLYSSSGFRGLVDGIFRLRANGSVQRALAVYEVTATGPVVASPPPAGFARTATQ